LKGLSRDGKIFVLETEKRTVSRTRRQISQMSQMSLKGFSRSVEMREQMMTRYSERYSSQTLMLTLRRVWKQLGLLA
jgi:hypothetical protein